MNCRNCPALLRIKNVNGGYFCAAKNEYLPFMGFCRVDRITICKTEKNIDIIIKKLNNYEKNKNGAYAMEFERYQNEI